MDGEAIRSDFQGFNLLTIGPEHENHSESSAIIKLEESGEVFCPLCLEKVSIPEDYFEKYVRRLFEALDQHGEKKHIRAILLPILEIILHKRYLKIESDHDFHNLLRVIYKILSSDKFRHDEFPAVTRMFSAISRRFSRAISIPVVSVSKATETIIECASKQLSKCLDENARSLRSDVIKLLRSVYATIRTYLELLSRFALARSSCLLFPLHENDDPQIHNGSYHKECQVNCLNFAQRRLFPPTIRHLKVADKLDALDISLISELFETMRECYLSASREQHTEFINFMVDEDCISLAHTLGYKCSDTELRAATRSFLKTYVLHHIGKKFEIDTAFETFEAQQDIVETNHKNAIFHSKDAAKSNRTVFYVMANYVAHDQKSQYYNQERLKKVICESNPSVFFDVDSGVVAKIYLHTASMVLRNVSVSENIEKFFKKLWDQISDNTKVNDFDGNFCSQEKVFFWAHRHTSFKRLITWRSIKRLIEDGFSRISMAYNTLKLLNDDFYKEQTIKYLENDESSIKLMERFTENIDGCEFHVADRYHRPLMTKLGAIIPTLLYNAIQKLMLSMDSLENIARTERLTKMILLWIDHCTHLDVLLDQDFIKAWFEIFDRIVAHRLEADEKFNNLIILFVQLICSLIRTNHNQLIIILAHLNYTSLSMMYTLLTNYSLDDRLGEAIAHLIVTYDHLDYPLDCDPVDGLLRLKPDTMYWMLSNSKDLHALSLRCAIDTFKNNQSRTDRAVVATCLINMIVENPDILKINEHVDIMRSIISEDEIKYNPLFSRLKDVLPPGLVDGSPETIETHVSSSQTSFISDDSNFFEEENISVMRILTQLQNEVSTEIDSSCTIPESLYVSRALIDRHINSVDTDDWERLASESIRNREQNI